MGTILAQFREDARSNRDLGDRFERLIVAFLRLDPLYVDLFSDVWLWNDWPGKGKVGDVGIDIVAQERATGDHWAIQCKFYLPEHTISKEDIDSFFTAAGRDPFTACMVVTTTDRWGKNAEDALQQTKRVSVARLVEESGRPRTVDALITHLLAWIARAAPSYGTMTDHQPWTIWASRMFLPTRQDMEAFRAGDDRARGIVLFPGRGPTLRPG